MTPMDYSACQAVERHTLRQAIALLRSIAHHTILLSEKEHIELGKKIQYLEDLEAKILKDFVANPSKFVSDDD